MELKKTPLHAKHLELGGKLVPFAGFTMPVQFTSIVDEHLSVRQEAGIFDVSHMGEISISGPNALEYVNMATTNDASKIDPFQAQYTTMLNDDGGVIDDLIVYRRKDDYLLVVNAANTERDFGWLTERAPEGVRLENQSDVTGQIALQGPKAQSIMAGVSGDGPSKLGYFHFMQTEIDGVSCLVSRTGYTGEDGFEIYLNSSDTTRVWDILMDGGPKPCGLGARNTLRLEMAFRLHGSDMDETTTPLEAGLGWVVKMEKPEFFGKQALLKQMEQGLPRKLIGLVSEAKRFPRHGCMVLVGGRPVGEVTSGGFSPSLGCGIALAYVDPAYAKRGIQFSIDVRGNAIEAKLNRGPFYKRASDK
jgi:aminomethyltransferase